ncbi:MAG: NTP transferase domain-containing protein [Methyloceanibacter sp.]
MLWPRSICSSPRSAYCSRTDGRAAWGGGDKCLLPLGGRPLLAHAIECLRPQVDTLVLSANGHPARFASFRLPVVADSIEDFAGPLAGGSPAWIGR